MIVHASLRLNYKAETNMKTREIPKNQWPNFFDNFSRRHDGWQTTLEIFGPELGAQVQERELAFEGIVDESDETRGNQLIIMFGAKPDDHITHTIGDPRQVSLEQSDGGADVALQIKSADGLTALLLFRSPMLPELADVPFEVGVCSAR